MNTTHSDCCRIRLSQPELPSFVHGVECSVKIAQKKKKKPYQNFPETLCRIKMTNNNNITLPQVSSQKNQSTLHLMPSSRARQLCSHKKIKYTCGECAPHWICIHGKSRACNCGPCQLEKKMPVDRELFAQAMFARSLWVKVDKLETPPSIY